MLARVLLRKSRTIVVVQWLIRKSKTRFSVLLATEIS